MKLAVIGAGKMGMTMFEVALEDGCFDEIILVEPLENGTWPEDKVDLIIDFSNPGAIKDIYDYCRKFGGNIPVVIGTTGYCREDEEILNLLSKICPVRRKSNFSRGLAIMEKMAEAVKQNILTGDDIRITEYHHINKKDAPSGTAKVLAECFDCCKENISSIRLGNVFGIHTVYIAMEDELLEITHSAFSKRVFASGALKAGKELLGIDEVKQMW